MNTVIFHYHIFKNAGTSLDVAFKNNFSVVDNLWVTKEFPANPALNRSQVEMWLKDNLHARCFSSHTMIFPPPKVEGIKVLPVIYLRHPLDRIMSAYYFERQQEDKNFGSVLAKNTSLSGYIKTRLALQGDMQCRNFQAKKFATMYGQKKGNEMERAILAYDHLPFVGLVEQFSKSLARLESMCRMNGFPEFSLKIERENIRSSSENKLEDRLRRLKDELGEAFYADLTELNAADFKIYNKAVKDYERNIPNE